MEREREREREREGERKRESYEFKVLKYIIYCNLTFWLSVEIFHEQTFRETQLNLLYNILLSISLLLFSGVTGPTESG